MQYMESKYAFKFVNKIFKKKRFYIELSLKWSIWYGTEKIYAAFKLFIFPRILKNNYCILKTECLL